MYALVNMMHYHQRDLLGIQFKLSDEQAIERMMARARPGETQSIMETRLKEYHDKTFPLLDAFSQHFDLITIDASGSIDEIHAEVMKIV
jgi:adenylate kinase